MEPAIEFKGVAKSYPMGWQPPFLARELFRRLMRRSPAAPPRLHWALRDLTFQVSRGSCTGVIGANGSGKSTLLSLIAGTSYATAGEVKVRGRIGPLLELGAGFHHDLTGYENIFLNASLLGLRRGEVEERLERIVDFAEIGEFLHAPLHSFSSGIQARLGFAVVAHIVPDILLVDEILAVGDQHFQEKCEQAIAGFRRRGATMVLVSHDLPAVERLCDRVLWIDQGRLRRSGTARELCREYRELFTAGHPGAG